MKLTDLALPQSNTSSPSATASTRTSSRLTGASTSFDRPSAPLTISMAVTAKSKRSSSSSTRLAAARWATAPLPAAARWVAARRASPHLPSLAYTLHALPVAPIPRSSPPVPVLHLVPASSLLTPLSIPRLSASCVPLVSSFFSFLHDTPSQVAIPSVSVLLVAGTSFGDLPPASSRRSSDKPRSVRCKTYRAVSRPQTPRLARVQSRWSSSPPRRGWDSSVRLHTL